METTKNYFAELNSVNVSNYIEKKNGLSYVSWANSWTELKKRYPNAIYTIYENKDGWNYHTDGQTCWVKTGVTVEGVEHIEYLPVMDFKNKSIPADKVTSFEVNKAIQRSLTKAVARHGLGLYVYAGEDLPEEEKDSQQSSTPQPANNALYVIDGNECKLKNSKGEFVALNKVPAGALKQMISNPSYNEAVPFINKYLSEIGEA